MRRRFRRLNESAEAAAAQFMSDATFENALARWGRCSVPELSVVLVHLRALSMVHQVNHWQSRGDPFFGDHLLFERLYTSTAEEIDRVAERAVGAGGPENVDLQGQLMHALMIVESLGGHGTIPVQAELAKRSLAAELGFLHCIDLAVCSMRETGTLTRGVDNLLGGIEDAHEANVYLLKQRTS